MTNTDDEILTVQGVADLLKMKTTQIYGKRTPQAVWTSV